MEQDIESQNQDPGRVILNTGDDQLQSELQFDRSAAQDKSLFDESMLSPIDNKGHESCIQVSGLLDLSALK